MAAAKRMYGSAAAYKSMTLELNASDARGIDVVRNQIKEFAGTKQLFSKGIKLIIVSTTLPKYRFTIPGNIVNHVF